MTTSEPPDIEVASGDQSVTGVPGEPGGPGGGVGLGGGRRAGRNVIAVVGIDRYQHERWPRLTNAVADARGAADLFAKLGFEPVAALYDDEATSEALEALVTDELSALRPEDSLVLFYSGHGTTLSHRIGDQVVKTGYLIPCDASDRTSTWIELDSWLKAVSVLPAKHILVILDACHSGIALNPVFKWRDGGAAEDLSDLKARPSRRIITSALEDERALDSGPRPGHSLFTGCLIDALTHGVGRPGSRMITGTELGLYLQRRVGQFPGTRQTPDFGTFDLDQRGELVLPFLEAPAVGNPAEPAPGPGPGDRKVIENVAPSPRRWRRAVLVGIAAVASAALATSLALCRSRDAKEPRSAIDPGVASSSDGAGSSCPVGMVRVPAGTFRMGSPEGEGQSNEHPQHEVTLSGYCIDRTEVTVKEYRACVTAGACSATTSKASLLVTAARPAPKSMWCNGAEQPDHPINCVSWDQAVAYCRWAKKRLPTEAEWEYAARGSEGRRHPWGDQPPSVRHLNACGSECALMAERELKEDWAGLHNDDDRWPTTAPVGSYPDGASPFGALDMAGNVAEWTADSLDKYPAGAVTDPQPSEDTYNHVSRGGSWASQNPSEVRAAARDLEFSKRGYLTIGFRCVRGD